MSLAEAYLDVANIRCKLFSNLKNNLWALFCGWGSFVSSYRAITRRQLTFCHKSQGVPDTQFIDLGRMKG